MNAPEIQEDYPINLKSQKVIDENLDKLPQMRFLFNNSEIFDLTI